MMKSMSKPRRVSNESSLSFGFISSIIKGLGGRASARPARSRDKKSVNGDDADYRRGSHGTCQTVVACVGILTVTSDVGSAAQPALQPVACSDLSAQREIVVDLCVVRTYSLVACEVCNQIERINYRFSSYLDGALCRNGFPTSVIKVFERPVAGRTSR